MDKAEPTIIDQSTHTSIAVIQTNIEFIKKDMTELKQGMINLSGVFATQASLESFRNDFEVFKKTEFGLLQRIVFGFIGLALTAVIVTVLINNGLRLK